MAAEGGSGRTVNLVLAGMLALVFGAVKLLDTTLFIFVSLQSGVEGFYFLVLSIVPLSFALLFIFLAFSLFFVWRAAKVLVMLNVFLFVLASLYRVAVMEVSYFGVLLESLLVGVMLLLVLADREVLSGHGLTREQLELPQEIELFKEAYRLKSGKE